MFILDPETAVKYKHSESAVKNTNEKFVKKFVSFQSNKFTDLRDSKKMLWGITAPAYLH